MTSSIQTKLPQVEFVEGRLRSVEYQDVFFAADGPEETRRVFLNPARIMERIARADEFTIAEFGAGTYLNFLSTCEEYLARNLTTRLRYFLIEAQPLAAKQIEQALAAWRPKLSLLAALLRYLPPQIRGWHRRLFSGRNIVMTVFHGDVETGIRSFLQQDYRGVDAWFLDGFDPAKNPAMWESNILSRLESKTKRNGTITTFSYAREVRNTLSTSGFRISRIDNLPHKRHTLLGELQAPPYSPPAHVHDVQVIGGGLAGVSTARALADKGFDVQLFERERTLAASTSAIPLAVQSMRLTHTATVESLYRFHAYTHASSSLNDAQSITRPGGLLIPGYKMPEARVNRTASMIGPTWAIPVDLRAARDMARTDYVTEGFLFPHTATINGRNLCSELANHPNIEVVCNQEVSVRLNENTTTVFATALPPPPQVVDLPPLEVVGLEGQLDEFDDHDQHKPTVVLYDRGYVAPCANHVVAGATYEYDPWKTDTSIAENRARLRRWWPQSSFTHRQSFRGIRAITSDHFPIVGRVNDRMWLNLGHGSSGSTSSLYCSELIASQIAQEVPPSSPDCIDLLDPYRFRRRQERRPNPFTSNRRRGKVPRVQSK